MPQERQKWNRDREQRAPFVNSAIHVERNMANLVQAIVHCRMPLQVNLFSQRKVKIPRPGELSCPMPGIASKVAAPRLKSQKLRAKTAFGCVENSEGALQAKA